MKFGKHLDQALYEPWRKHYLDYKRLKDLLTELFNKERDEEVPLTSYGSFDESEQKEVQSWESAEARFLEELHAERKKVEKHYRVMEEKLEKSFEAMAAQAEAGHADHDQPAHQDKDAGHLRSMNIACVNLYRTLNMLNNFVYLNRIGFDKIAKKFDKACGGHYRKKFEEEISKSNFVTSKGVTELLQKTADFYATHFEHGDKDKAKVRLLAKMAQGSYRKSDMLWLGSKIGIVVTLAFWNLFNLCVSPNLHIKEGMEVYIPLYRAVGQFLALMWMWGFNIWIWSTYRVNHVFIFEISPRHKVSHLEIWDEAASLSAYFLLNSLLFLHHQQYHLRTQLSEIFYPLALIAFIVVKIIIQVIGTSSRSLQADIVHSMGNIFIAPFGRARFRDCYLADYFCSMQKIFADLQYCVCFYAVGTFSTYHLEASEANANYCLNLGPILVPLVHAIPYWWRFCQCLHRYNETHERWPNLANAFKYTLCQVSVIIGSLHPFFSNYESPWSPYRMFWLALLVVTTLYTYVWDIIVDWGFLQFDSDRYPMLRSKRLYPKAYFYYFAMASNLILRFLWVVTLIPFPFQSFFSSGVEYQHILLPVLTLAELYRRSQWGILRVEYEHLSTSQGFRKYKHLPLYFDRAVAREKRPPRAVWVNVEAIFMASVLIFFSVVVWVW
eukprot:CAMPEP_0114514500 /NCGR_PEP_ID=MMETSP0109-20121206/16189_1 /TAXON_ID=29199 /ORGANISM="Chlorarachnion reptans, Strain CCCM449" /LENGTH=666 /DNA_ID=CAMNT_0001694549 /DNA_START=134 /DNA_END=2131 /DNA_ORIENTATION=+